MDPVRRRLRLRRIAPGRESAFAPGRAISTYTIGCRVAASKWKNGQAGIDLRPPFPPTENLDFSFERMRQVPYLFLAAISLLAGCASTSTLMVNDEGQFADCGTRGAGVIGAAAALLRTRDCISEYRTAGYRETGAPAIIGPQSATMQDAAAAPITFQSTDGLFKMTLPADWIQIAPPSAAYQLFAKNSIIESGLLVRSIESKEFRDWESYTQSLRAKLTDSLKQGTSSGVERIKVNGFDALRADISGELKHGAKLHYLGTAIKTGQKLIWLVAWCDESRFAANRSELEQLAAGLQL
jgi:hypothetical protein